MKVNSKLIKLGLDKINKKNTYTWDEIGAMFNVSGEKARQMVKNYRYNNNLIADSKYEKGRDRILIMSDLHIPDHNEELILNTIQENKNVNLIILAGDILDCKAVSSWANEEITILDLEMIEAHKLLRKIREITKAKIVLVKGNHEQRVNRHYAKFAKLLGSSVVETEILYKLANGFTIKTTEDFFEYPKIKNVEYAGGLSFLYGDLLVNHPATFSKINMKTIVTMYKEKFKDKYPRAKNIIIGHTHQSGMLHIEKGITLIECGCMCKAMSYAAQDDKPMGIQQNAYVYLEMQDGIVDKSTIQLKHLGFVQEEVKEFKNFYEEDEDDNLI